MTCVNEVHTCRYDQQMCALSSSMSQWYNAPIGARFALPASVNVSRRSGSSPRRISERNKSVISYLQRRVRRRMHFTLLGDFDERRSPGGLSASEKGERESEAFSSPKSDLASNVFELELRHSSRSVHS